MTRKYLENQIINQSRHQFIYGYDTDERSYFLKDLSLKNKITQDNPIVIYIDDLGLPKKETLDLSLDYITLSSISRDYLNFTILINLIKKILSELKISKEKEISFINRINKLYLNKGYSEITSLEEFLENIIISQKTYKDIYLNYLQTGNIINPFDKLAIPFVFDIESIINLLKTMINNNSYIILLIDYHNPTATISIQAINSLIGSRINKTLSIKVATDINSWPTYYDLNHRIIENIHDYGEVSFDLNYQDCLQRIKNKYDS